MAFPEPFGAYTLLANLGHGGMAEVFLARKSGPGGFSKLVVIKRILPHLAREPEFVQMFLDEARLAARLDHPNVVQLFDMGQEGQTYFLAMEYLGGETTAGVARRAKAINTTLGATFAARIIAEACEGLHYAHEFKDVDGSPMNIVHRDMSPQNIFVTYEGRVKVLDFGVAKAATRLSHTRTGTVKGKISYMSPEQCRGDVLDRRSDVFALGVVLFEMVAGRRMFRDESEFALLKKIGSGDFTRPSQLAEEAPAALLAICDRAMAVDAKDRYATAREMRAALDAYLTAAGAEVGPDQLAKKMVELFAADIEFRKQLLMASDDRAEVFQMLSKEGSDSFPSLGALALTGERTAWARRSTVHKDLGKRTAVGVVGLLTVAGAVGAFVFINSRPKPVPPQAAAAQTIPEAPAPEPKTPLEPKPAEPRKEEVATPVAPKAAESETKPAPAAPHFGYLDVVSRPDHCAANVGGKAAGFTPLKRRRVEANQSVTVTVDCPGYERETRNVKLSAGEVSSIEFAPTAKPAGTGFLTLKTSPWSVVYEGATSLGMTPLARVQLPAGKHTLRCVNDEKKIEKTVQVEVRPGETTSQSVDLGAP
jgi:serine/threonine protein kinase